MHPDSRIRADSILEDSGTRRVGKGNIQKVGNGRYAPLPSLIADMLDAQAKEEVEIFVNLELGCVIHRFQEADDDGPE